MTDSTPTPDPTNNPATAASANPATQPSELQAPADTPGQQPFGYDRNHEQNEVAGASRGEFGRQSDHGTTQGGYGNELSRGDATYAGTLDQPAATSGYDGEREQRPAGQPSAENGSFGTQAVGAGQPAGSAVGSHFANDNAAPQGTDSGFADDYGTTSLGGAATSAQPQTGQRNQQEDYTPNHPEGGPQGLHTGAAPSNTSQGTAEAEAMPGTGSRSGYQAAGSGDAQGGAEQGFGSKGGSYNDEYDDARPAPAAGSPAQGDFDTAEGARNYGGASDDRTNAAQSPDYGAAPGRTGSPD